MAVTHSSTSVEYYRVLRWSPGMYAARKCEITDAALSTFEPGERAGSCIGGDLELTLPSSAGSPLTEIELTGRSRACQP